MIAYRALCFAMAGLAVWALFGHGSRQQKVATAVLVVPLLLRALLIK
jgi:hypothetical protein